MGRCVLRWCAVLVVALGCGKHINPEWCEQHSDPACNQVLVADATPGEVMDPPPSCTSDDMCPSGLCLPAGTCADPDALLYASTDGIGNACTATQSCPLTVAVAGATDERHIVVLSPGSYGTALAINRSMTIIGRDATLQAPVRGDAITVANNAELELDYLTITGAVRGSAITCLNGRLSGHLLTITGNQQGITSACGLELDRSVIRGNVNGALEVTAGAVDIRNNFIVKNGDSMLGKTANVVISPGVIGSFAFNTVAYNESKQNGNPGVGCDSSMVTGVGNLVTDNVRNGAFPTPQAIGACDFTLSYTAGGTGNNDQRWVSVDTLDFHLTADSILALDQAGATCSASDDIDGESRPSGGGCDLGADELHRE